jgi:hypothetical protein
MTNDDQKKAMSEKIAEQIKEYLAKGGKITKLPNQAFSQTHDTEYVKLQLRKRNKNGPS